MNDKLMRGGLVLLGLIGLDVGIWATLWPRSFYDDFPGGGRAWVAADGPYNEHLLRDLGALNLALVAVVAVALASRSLPAVRAAGLGWLVYSVPHLVYHVGHRHLLPTASDRVQNTIVLTVTVVVAAGVLALSYARPPRSEPARSPAEAERVG